MIKLLSIVILILSIVLAPPAVLAFVSNNAVPGDATYPIKRSLENVIVAISSINPTTKAWFSQTRSERRYKELSTLIAQGKQTSDTINELVEQTGIAANQISKVNDPQEKAKLIAQLSASIQKYDTGLQQYSSKESESIAQNTSEDTSSETQKTVSATNNSVASPITVPGRTENQSSPTPMPTSLPSKVVATNSPSSIPSTSSVLTHPTTTPSVQPTPKSASVSTSNPSTEAEKKKQIEIEEARKRLEEINKLLEEEKNRSVFSAQEQKNESNTDNEKKVEKTEKPEKSDKKNK